MNVKECSDLDFQKRNKKGLNIKETYLKSLEISIS